MTGRPLEPETLPGPAASSSPVAPFAAASLPEAFAEFPSFTLPAPFGTFVVSLSLTFPLSFTALVPSQLTVAIALRCLGHEVDAFQ